MEHMDPTYILNLANNIVRHGTAIATLAEMTALPPKEDMVARCNDIKRLADDILSVYEKGGSW